MKGPRGGGDLLGRARGVSRGLQQSVSGLVHFWAWVTSPVLIGQLVAMAHRPSQGSCYAL